MRKYSANSALDGRITNTQAAFFGKVVGLLGIFRKAFF